MGKLKKQVGFNYLHRHSTTEQQLGVDSEHVIVDRKDWEEVVNYFHDNPEEVEKLEKPTLVITNKN